MSTGSIVIKEQRSNAHNLNTTVGMEIKYAFTINLWSILLVCHLVIHLSKTVLTIKSIRLVSVGCHRKWSTMKCIIEE